MPYNGVPSDLTDKMDRCVRDVMKTGKDKSSAIAICHSQLVGSKKGGEKKNKIMKDNKDQSSEELEELEKAKNKKRIGTIEKPSKGENEADPSKRASGEDEGGKTSDEDEKEQKKSHPSEGDETKEHDEDEPGEEEDDEEDTKPSKKKKAKKAAKGGKMMDEEDDDEEDDDDDEEEDKKDDEKQDEEDKKKKKKPSKSEKSADGKKESDAKAEEDEKEEEETEESMKIAKREAKDIEEKDANEVLNNGAADTKDNDGGNHDVAEFDPEKQQKMRSIVVDALTTAIKADSEAAVWAAFNSAIKQLGGSQQKLQEVSVERAIQASFKKLEDKLVEKFDALKADLQKTASTEEASKDKPVEKTEKVSKEEDKVEKTDTSSEGAVVTKDTVLMGILNDIKERVKKIEEQPMPSKAHVYAKSFDGEVPNQQGTELQKVQSELDELTKERDKNPELFTKDVKKVDRAMTLIARKKALSGM